MRLPRAISLCSMRCAQKTRLRKHLVRAWNAAYGILVGKIGRARLTEWDGCSLPPTQQLRARVAQTRAGRLVLRDEDSRRICAVWDARAPSSWAAEPQLIPPPPLLCGAKPLRFQHERVAWVKAPQLPPEMLAAILQNLSARERLEARGVSRLWRDLVDDDTRYWERKEREARHCFGPKIELRVGAWDALPSARQRFARYAMYNYEPRNERHVRAFWDALTGDGLALDICNPSTQHVNAANNMLHHLLLEYAPPSRHWHAYTYHQATRSPSVRVEMKRVQLPNDDDDDGGRPARPRRVRMPFIFSAHAQRMARLLDDKSR